MRPAPRERLTFNVGGGTVPSRQVVEAAIAHGNEPTFATVAYNEPRDWGYAGLLAFTAVCAGVVVLRHTQPDTPRPFRVPFATFTGVAGVAICLAMTFFLPHDTWVRLAVWTGIGFLIYFLYGYRHSRIRQQA